jgi:hypothetical protein
MKNHIINNQIKPYITLPGQWPDGIEVTQNPILLELSSEQYPPGKSILTVWFNSSTLKYGASFE